ncbi:hypothetical protein AOQ84DRAFT_199174 [Glonium stellatum]|uniref:RNA polymerase II subunit B1 CTD phosphatase RPAP2 homolog n=1 Tax=Glonium stellatum TaxID=574774 RepID=A0A8E2JVL6_9PEZI|nr:hypothetical protein AOQ84DRAFT_199174 [Glonium stellatum]
MGPKSILKKTSSPTNSPPSASRPQNERHLEIALHHANLIQEQKDVERDILKAAMTLIEFPSAPDANPARPAQSDASQFTNLIVPFQPSDYDSLIEERNIADLCGYALCPRPPKRAPLAGKLQFIDTKDRGVQIVNKKELEIWCSDDCARRALYVKVQLNEEPAWMRRGGIGDKIDLLIDNIEEHHHTVLPLRPKHQEHTTAMDNDLEELQKDIDEEEEAWALRDEAMEELARERGDQNSSISKKDLIKSTIEEKILVKAPIAPSLENDTADPVHVTIEGYTPKIDTSKDQKPGEDKDADDKDWDI